jgi:hypothetical protein
MEKLLLLTLLVMGLTSCVVGEIEAPQDKAARVAPRITSISPNNGPPSGGTSLTISGTDFDSGTTVTIGGSLCSSLTFVNSGTLTCLAPASTVGVKTATATNSRDLTGSLTSGYTYNPVPTVSFLVPSAGGTAGGEQVTITGTGFLDGATATIAGVTCSSPTVLTSSTLTCTTGPQAATVGQAIVTNPDGQSSVAAGTYVYNNRPTVTSLSANAGALAGGTSLTLTGTFFVAGQTSVTIGGANCGGVVVATATSLTCTTTANTAGIKDLVVTNTLSTLNSTLSNAFTYQAAPTFTSITPNAGNIAGGTTVAVVGTGFDTVNGLSMDIGGSNCVVSAPSLTSTGFTCVTTARAAASVATTITNADGDSQSIVTAASYTYQPGPTITSLAPNAGALAGGTTTVLTGTGFISGAVITIDGVVCTPLVFTSATTMSCTTGANTAGAKNIIVTNPDGQTGSLASGFTHQAAPTIASVSPNGGPLAGGTTVTITGTGFDTANGINNVSFGGSSCGGVAALTATSFTCVTTAHAAGAVDVIVTNNDGDLQAVTGTGLFTYRNAPSVTSAAPTAGPLAGGTTIAVTGTGFVTGATVSVGGVACSSPTVLSGTSLTCVTGVHAAGATTIVVTNPDTQVSAAGGSFTYQAAPTITSIDRNAGGLAGGAAVTITGTGFVTGATVSIGTFVCNSLTVVTSTSITCTTTGTAPAGAQNVVVTNADGQSASLTNGFTYQAPPTITSLNPVGGDPAGGTIVFFVGTGFDTVNGVSSITIGGTACGTINVVSSTSVRCTTGARAAASDLDVVITNNDGNSQSATLSNAFSYQAAPTVSATSPIGGPLAGGTTITLTGTNFSSGATVTIGGINCSSVNILSPTSLTCVTGANTAGFKTITVQNLDTQTSAPFSGYTYGPAPTVTAVDKTAGALGGGASVDITGTGFLPTPTVDIGGVACTPVVYNSATSISCTTTANTVGAKTVTVTNPDLQLGMLASGFTYQVAPTVASISPSVGTTLGGELLTLTGTGFDIVNGIASVTLGGSNCAIEGTPTATSLTCRTTAHAAGSVALVLTNDDANSQAVTNAAFFDYFEPPTISSIDIPNGSADGGTTIRITGTGFNNAGGTSITIGGFACTTVTYVSPTTIDCVTGAATPGTYTITITNFDGQTVTRSSYTYDPPPVFTSLNNSEGSTGGNSLIINGSNFQTSPTVTVGGAACTVTFDNSGQITCTLPAGALGAQDIVITNPDGQSVTATGAFTYVAAPTVTSVAPSIIDSSATTSITINGTGFLDTASAPTVVIDSGGTNSVCAGPVVSGGGTVITCTAPAHAAGTVNILVTNADLNTQSNAPSNIFTYVDPPTVASVLPTAGVLTGGTAITITGTNFVAAPAPLVTIDGVDCTGIVVTGSTQIDCNTPAGSAGAKDIVVTQFSTLTGTLTNGYTYNPPPTVTSVDETFGPDTGGRAITITGTNFVSAPSAITIDGVACSATGFTSSTIVTCTTDTQAAPTQTAGNIVVTNPDGQVGTGTSLYTYTELPTVTSITPNNGAATGSEPVTITGTKFFTGDTVTIGGAACTGPVVVNNTTITCTTPALAAGTHDIIVSHNGADTRSSVALSNGWTSEPVPTISSLTETTGTTSGGTVTTINGTNFEVGSTVTFGGNAATVINTAGVPTSLVVQTPASVTATAVDVIVSNTTGQSVTSSGAYTYTPAGPELSWVEGVISPNPPNPALYGSSNSNISFIYTLTNSGAVTTSTITISSIGADPAAFFFDTGSGDNCTGTTLAPGASCTVQVTFLAGFQAVGTYNDILQASDGTTSDTNDMTGTVVP